MTSSRRRIIETLAIVAVGAALVALRPFPYDVRVLTLVAIYALAGVGLNVLVGYTGIVSVGHAAFLLFGAYSWALLVPAYSGVLAVAVALVLGVSISLALGWLCLRFRGYYLAIATLAFGLIVWATSKNWESLTHGNNGIANVPRVELPLVSGGISVFLVTLLMLAFFFWVQDSLRSSRLGVSMLATRGDEEAASSLGISIPNTRILAFVFSAVPTVIGGVLLAQLTTYVHPDQFEVPTSVSLIAIPIIGGRGWRWAPILGALFVVALPEYVRFLSEYRLVLYGVLLTAIALFFPDGMRQIGQEIAGLWSRRGRRPEPTVPGPTPAEQADQPLPDERIAVSPRKRASGE